MGIPKFGGWLGRHPEFRRSVTRINEKHPTPLVEGEVDILALDMNALIYNHLELLKVETFIQEGQMFFSEQELIRRQHLVYQAVFNEVEALVRMVKPKVSLILAFDGTAPMAKVMQQRNRRYRSAANRGIEEVFDSNEITPGTDFMFGLDRFMREQLDNNTRRPPFPRHIVYSSHLVPGEGEHKIADRLRQIPAEGQTAMIYGLDADLILIYLLRLRQNWRNIYLFRDDKQRRNATVVDLKTLARIISEYFPDVPDPVNDFMILITLIGSDFLPHFPTFERVPDALTGVTGGYRNFILADIAAGTKPKGLTFDLTIEWDELTRFFQYFDQTIAPTLLKQWAENTDNLIKFPSSVATACINQLQIARAENVECVRVFDPTKFRDAWYQYVFSSKVGLGTYGPSPEDLQRMILAYLEGLAWIHRYYLNGSADINPNWFYPYYYTPYLGDLLLVLGNRASFPIFSWINPIAPNPNELTLTPLDVLLMVMPRKSILGVPEPIRILYAENSSILDLLPAQWLTDTQGKMEDWEAFAILPFPQINRVRRALIELKLPQSYWNRFAPQENYVLDRRSERLIARPGIGRGRSVTRSRGAAQPPRRHYQPVKNTTVPISEMQRLLE